MSTIALTRPKEVVGLPSRLGRQPPQDDDLVDERGQLRDEPDECLVGGDSVAVGAVGKVAIDA